MADKAREDRHPVVPAAEPSPPATASRRSRRRHRAAADVAYLEVIDPSAEAPAADRAEADGDAPEEGVRTPASASAPTSTASPGERTIRSTPAVYRWVCPCQNPPVLLATYGPNARINIKVRDRYWHLHGFGMVEAICPRCAAEHVLDLRHLHRALESGEEPAPSRIHRSS